MDNGPQLDSVASLHLRSVGLLGDGGLSTLAARLRELDEISTSAPPAKRSLAIPKPILITSTPSWTLYADSADGMSTSPGFLSRPMGSVFYVRNATHRSPHSNVR
jgi:hypothetical protein